MISIITAIANDGVVGYKNDLPWREGKLVPKDFPHFIEQTRNHCVISGKNTFESMGMLKKRRNIVISKTLVSSEDELIAYPTLDECLLKERSICENEGREIFLLGGPGLWREAILKGLVDRIMITRLQATFQGDTFFPEHLLKENFKTIYSTSVLWKEEPPKISSTFELLIRK